MLTIHEGFPIKKMALYGSTAFIVGFAGTITMLREYAPRDDAGNISVVHPSNKQDTKSNVSNQIPKTDEKNDNKTPDPVAPLAASTPVAGSGTLSTRQASPMAIGSSTPGGMTSGTMSVAPTTSQAAPLVNNSSQPTGSTTTTTQPGSSDSTPLIINPLPSTPLLQNTVEGVTDSTKILP
jgi:ABC-type phosphate transport system substrate-binding protein